MTYEYEFLDTGDRVDADTYGLAEIDGRPVRRVYAASFTLKGGGWHHTEYPKKGHTKLQVQGGLNHRE